MQRRDFRRSQCSRSEGAICSWPGTGCTLPPFCVSVRLPVIHHHRASSSALKHVCSLIVATCLTNVYASIPTDLTEVDLVKNAPQTLADLANAARRGYATRLCQSRNHARHVTFPGRRAARRLQ